MPSIEKLILSPIRTALAYFSGIVKSILTGFKTKIVATWLEAVI